MREAALDKGVMAVPISAMAGARTRAVWWIGTACVVFAIHGEAYAQLPSQPPVEDPPPPVEAPAPPEEPPPPEAVGSAPKAPEPRAVNPPPPAPPPAPEGLSSSEEAPEEAPAPEEDLSWIHPRRFGGTNLDWSHHISATTLGIGRDYIGSEGDSYVMVFALSLGYFPVWKPRHKLGVATGVAMGIDVLEESTSLTKSDGAPDILDIPLSLRYVATLHAAGGGRTTSGPAAMRDPTLLGEGDWRTWALASGSLLFPASEESRARGLVLATSLDVGLRQQIKLLGSAAPGLKYMVVTAGFGWAHPFRSASGLSLPTSLPVENVLSYELNLLFALYEGLELSSGFRLNQSFLSAPETEGPSCDVFTQSEGCIDVGGGVEPDRTSYSTLFRVGLAYEIIPEFAVSVGYTNAPLTLGPDGRRRNPFYSPEASFSAGLTFSFDRLYQRFAAPPESSRRF